MRQWLFFLLFVPVFSALMYLLYCRGILVTKSIRAIIFLFQPGASTERATLDSCTGWVSHAGRFRESQTYTFTLDLQLSKGFVEVSLLDRKKQPLLTLNQYASSSSIALDGKSRYYLRWVFQNATGKCELRWQSSACP